MKDIQQVFLKNSMNIIKLHLVLPTRIIWIDMCTFFQWHLSTRSFVMFVSFDLANPLQINGNRHSSEQQAND